LIPARERAPANQKSSILTKAIDEALALSDHHRTVDMHHGRVVELAAQ
jgi:hypothetical protein